MNIRTHYHKQCIISDGNVITIKSLSNRNAVRQLIGILKYGDRVKKWTVETDEVKGGVFPNAVVAIAGILDSLRAAGYEFDIRGKYAHLFKDIPEYDHLVKRSLMHRVWRFTNMSINDIVKDYMTEVQKSDEFPKGFLQALEWSLNEVMDNVERHSKVDHGYVMCEIHKNSKQIAFAIFDAGQGIYNSFRNSKQSQYTPKNTLDAITLALQEEVTSNSEVGQGNGLYGLQSIIKQNNGSLTITSGNGMFQFENGITRSFVNYPLIPKLKPSTSVDFQLNYGSDVSLEDALNFRGKTHNLVYLNFEDMEDDMGNIVYRIAERGEGTGTREAALRCKNEILNILKEKPTKIIIDFAGVNIMSSSFADELIAKLFIDLGLFQFNKLISIIGLENDPTQQSILQRSVLQRINESLNSESNNSSK